MTRLLDSNVLLALAVLDHVHHRAASQRWVASDEPLAKGPITEGPLTRLVVRARSDGSAARRVLDPLTSRGSPIFWPDDIAYGSIDLSPVVGRA